VYSKRFSAGEGVPADAKALNFVDQLDKFAGGPWEAQTIVSAPWHEAVYIYAQAVKDANSLDSDKVQAALEKMRNYPGTGIYTTYSFGTGERNGFQASDLTIVYAAEVQKGVYKRPPNAP
jgi:ABC-type branched-subunit amino acid transport system substrate-binding protein